MGVPGASRWRVPTPWVALVCVYVFWGSTYLGIRVAVESFPPFTMAGVRYLLAGAILYPIARLRRGGPPPTRQQWLGAASVAGLLLVGGNGLLSYAEQTVPSGVAALLVATVPLWLVLLDRVRGAARLRPLTRAGLALGLVGIVLLVRPWTTPEVDRVGALVVLVASVLWALGSIRSRSAPAPSDGSVATGMQMLVGGLALLTLGTVTGEWARVDLASASWASVAAVAWLVVPGSIVALTAYNHALRTLPTSTVATYAYVNPVVAVALGWVLLGERHEPTTLLAGAVIAVAVVIIVSRPRVRPAAATSSVPASAPSSSPQVGAAPSLPPSSPTVGTAPLVGTPPAGVPAAEPPVPGAPTAVPPCAGTPPSAAR